MASNVDCRHLCGYDTDERDVLVDVDAFSNEILTEPPHLISAEILVLECEFYIIRLARVFIELNRHFRHRVVYQKLQSCLIAYLCYRDFSVVPDTEYLGDAAGDGYLEKMTETSSHGKLYTSASGWERHTCS